PWTRCRSKRAGRPSASASRCASCSAYVRFDGDVWWYVRWAPQYSDSSDRSRDQLATGRVRASIAARARAETLIGARPGGADRHFWEPAYAASTPTRSRSTGIPPYEVTQSATSSAPYSLAM